MVDCLHNESYPVDSIIYDDGTVKNGVGCLTATVLRCMISDHAEYDLQIKHPAGQTWFVTRRYRQFRSLRMSLYNKYNLSDAIVLPNRKLFNNLSPTFVCQRSQELEEFLNQLLLHYTLPPPPLAEFIDWEKYDIHGITNALCRQIFKESNINTDENFCFTMELSQLSSVNRRIISPISNNLFNQPNEDFRNLVSFLGKLKRLKLIGSIEKLHKSNVSIKTLQFDMSPFKNLHYLELRNVDLGKMRGFEQIKTTVTELVVHHSLKNLKNLMLGDLFAAGDGDWVYGETPISTHPWNQIKFADFSNNFLHSIDQTVALLPQVQILNFSSNLLTDLASLTSLVFLRVLYLEDNQLYIGEEANLELAPTSILNTSGLHLNEENDSDPTTTTTTMLPEGIFLGKSSLSANASNSSNSDRRKSLPPLRSRIGEVQVLSLANNGLRSANLVAGINSLQHLDLSCNKINSFSELTCIGELRNLNSIDIFGNPICDHPYYRRNVLDLLGPRYYLILLDGSRANDKEIEIVQLFRALKLGSVSPLSDKVNNSICSTMSSTHSPVRDIQLSDDPQFIVETKPMCLQITNDIQLPIDYHK